MFGERLKLARNRAGLSLRALADKLEGKVSAQALGKYERGEMMPSSTVLIALSKELNLPLSYFLSPTQAKLDKVEFRKHSKTSAKEKARVEAEVLQRVEAYIQIESILELDSAFWHKPCEEMSLSDLEDCEELAQSVREKWELGNDPIPNMTQLLERHGIKVLLLELPSNVFGLTCIVHRPNHEDVTCIVVNKNTTLERRRFTLAHELGHKVMDPEKLKVDEEKAAQYFAGAFLMPKKHLEDEIGKQRKLPAYSELIQIKRIYRVSGAALLVRLAQIGVITEDTKIYAFKTYAKNWRKVEPEPLESVEKQGSIEAPQRFQRLCYRALSEKLISLPKAAELLQRPIKDIEKEIKGPGIDDRNHYQ